MKEIVLLLIQVVIIAIVARIIISWLVLAGVRGEFVSRLDYALSYITEPIMRPLRRVVPTIGMIDITPMVAIILLVILQSVVRELL